MIFLELEQVLNSEYGVSLNELIYKVDRKKRDHILGGFSEVTSSLDNTYHFNKVINFLAREGDIQNLYAFLRYYLEFPIFTAELLNGKIVSDYRYISNDIPLKYLNVTAELEVEFDFTLLNLQDNELNLKGYAYIPFISFEREEDIKKELVIVSKKNEIKFQLNNILSEEVLELGNGVYYYTYGGFEEKIILENSAESLKCFLELTTSHGMKYRTYCFHIENNQIQVNTELTGSKLNKILNKVKEPELLFVEPESQKLNLYLQLDENLITFLRNSSHTDVEILLSNDFNCGNLTIVNKEIIKNNIKYLNYPLLRVQLDSKNMIGNSKNYILFSNNNKKVNIKYFVPNYVVLNKMYFENTGMYLTVFSNKKNNIELHIDDKLRPVKKKSQTGKLRFKIVKILKKVKRRIGV